MTIQARCPRHPQHPVDDCPRCEPLIEREEARREGHFDEDDDRGEREYERYVERWGEG